MKHIYVVLLCNAYEEISNVSQECYETFEEAKNFIESRKSRPKRISDSWVWETDDNWVIRTYLVKELTVKESV